MTDLSSKVFVYGELCWNINGQRESSEV